MSKYLIIFEDGASLQGDRIDDSLLQACLDGYCDIYSVAHGEQIRRMSSGGGWEVVDLLESPE